MHAFIISDQWLFESHWHKNVTILSEKEMYFIFDNNIRLTLFPVIRHSKAFVLSNGIPQWRFKNLTIEILQSVILIYP